MEAVFQHCCSRSDPGREQPTAGHRGWELGLACVRLNTGLQAGDGLLVPTFGEGSRVSSPYPGVRTENVPLSQVQMKVTSNASCPRKWTWSSGLPRTGSARQHTLCCHPVKALRGLPFPCTGGCTHTRTRGTDTWGNIR